jgi:uncharacterized protein
VKIEIPRIPPAVARKLGYCVYLYVNPLDDSVFYVGKGIRGRALAQLHAKEKKMIAKIIREIRRSDAEPRIEILAHGLLNSETALKVEAASIDLLGLDNLANAVHGHGAGYGRMPLNEVVAHYTRRKATVLEPAILVRINQLYRYGMTDVELYDATRGVWKVVGPRRDAARFALSVFEGIVREIYRISEWLPAGSTFNVRQGGRGVRSSRRWEFVGTIADDKIRRRYLNRYVGHLFARGNQSPSVGEASGCIDP